MEKKNAKNVDIRNHSDAKQDLNNNDMGVIASNNDDQCPLCSVTARDKNVDIRNHSDAKQDLNDNDIGVIASNNDVQCPLYRHHKG